ncbi:MAG: helix-turn-helix domain-containing protein [Flavobacteriia bacterium]|nr:helix-turn-helix domain-containing protein [Flavobacteriia bacterium]
MDWRYLLEGDLLVEFGGRVKIMRKQAGLSQQDLADHIGTTRVRIGEIERGKNTSLIFVLRILKVFNKINDLEEIMKVERISPKTMFESGK